MDWLISWAALAIAVGSYVEATVRNKKLEDRIRALEKYNKADSRNIR